MLRRDALGLLLKSSLGAVAAKNGYGSLDTLLAGSEITYRQAQSNPSLRQLYLNELVQRYKPPVPACGVEYMANMYVAQGPLAVPSTMFTIFYFNEKSLVGAEIDICRAAFDIFSNEDEFASTVVHEYTHVEQMFNIRNINNPPEIRPEFLARAITKGGDLFDLVHELDAYDRQIADLGRWQRLTEHFKDSVHKAYNNLVDILTTKQSTPTVLWLREKYVRK